MNWKDVAKKLGECETIEEVQAELTHYEALEYKLKEEKLMKFLGHADQLMELAERGPVTAGTLCKEAARKVESSKLALIGVALVGDLVLKKLFSGR